MESERKPDEAIVAEKRNPVVDDEVGAKEVPNQLTSEQRVMADLESGRLPRLTDDLRVDVTAYSKALDDQDRREADLVKEPKTRKVTEEVTSRPPNAKARRAAERATARKQASADKSGVPLKLSRKAAKKLTPEEVVARERELNRAAPVSPVPPQMMERVVYTKDRKVVKKDWKKRTGAQKRIWLSPQDLAKVRALAKEEAESEERAWKARLATTPQEKLAYERKWAAVDRSKSARGVKPASKLDGRTCGLVKHDGAPDKCPSCGGRAISHAYPSLKLRGSSTCYRRTCMKDWEWGTPLEGRVEQLSTRPKPKPMGQSEQGPGASSATVTAPAVPATRSVPPVTRSEVDANWDARSDITVRSATQLRNQRRRRQYKSLRLSRSSGDVSKTDVSVGSDSGDFTNYVDELRVQLGLKARLPNLPSVDVVEHPLLSELAIMLDAPVEVTSGDDCLGANMTPDPVPPPSSRVKKSVSYAEVVAPAVGAPEGMLYTQRQGRAYHTGKTLPLVGLVKGPLGMGTRDKLRKEIEVLDPGCVAFLRMKTLGMKRTAQLRTEMGRRALQYLESHHKDDFQGRIEEMYRVQNNSVTVAMKPDYHDEEYRQQMKDPVNNEVIRLHADAVEGRLGNQGLLGRARVLPSHKLEQS